MRLNSIKLSGFKSFAEPTNFLLPGQLVGVVGPNGCGKSNIMDAVRWVLGESRASELRGESMQDVIFNGTNSRKPASRASVELVFDNADHRAGGQWSQFAEIAVKRVLTRDGTSSYYINNQPVRRRDVQDVFLGTGLGPRAYAIIGQGTISRIIESKPEELRLFLEEAAGVSKYKERRRETESRLSDTRENLTRVEDILRELNANLDKLEKQAEVAQQYNALQTDATLKQQQLWFLKRAESESDQAKVKADAEKSVNDLESRLADLRRVESDLETIRQAHYAAGDQVNQAQGQLYEASAEVGRLEAEIRFVVEGRQRVEQRLAQLKEQTAQWSARKDDAVAEVETLAEQGVAAEEQAVLLAAQVEEQAQQLPDLEEGLRQAQARSTEQRSQVAQVQQQIQVLAADQRNIEEQSRQLGQRRERLAADRNALAAPDEVRLAQIQTQLAAAQEAAETADGRLHELQEQVPQLDEERRTRQQAANSESHKQADLSARMEALKALQEKVRTDGKLKPWLARHGLEGLQGLWSRIHIQQGWESALESALRERMNSLEVSRLDMVRSFAGDAPPAKLAFYSPPQAGAPEPASSLPRLADLLRLGDAGQKALLTDWLHGCYTAASFDEALAARDQLKAGEAIYVPSGHAVTAHSVSFYAQDSEQAGLLARQQEIENLEKQLRAQALMAEEARSALVRAEAAFTDASQRLVGARREAADTQSRSHELQVETLRLTQLAEQTRARGEQIAADLAEVDALLEELQERRVTAEGRFEELDMQLADSQERHAQIGDQVIAAERRLAECREQQRGLERQAQEAQFARRSVEARKAELQRAIATASEQAASITGEEERAREELARLTDAAAQAGLQSALALKLEREQSLGAKRSEYDDLTARLRASDERRLQLERDLDPLRQRITDFQLKEQAARLGFEQYSQLLADAQADLDGGGTVDPAGQCAAVRPAGRDRSPAPRDRGPRRGQPGGAGGTHHRPRAQAVPGCAIGGPERSDHHPGRRDPQDRRRNPRTAGRHLQHRQRAFRQDVPRAVRRRQRPAGDDRRRNPRLRGPGAGPAAGQEEPDHPPAVGWREGAHGHRAGVRDLPAQPCAVLPARRGRRAAGRRQYRALCQAGDQHEPGNPVPFHQPQQDRHGNGRTADRRHHAGARRLAHRGGGHGVGRFDGRGRMISPEAA